MNNSIHLIEILVVSLFYVDKAHLSTVLVVELYDTCLGSVIIMFQVCNCYLFCSFTDYESQGDPSQETSEGKR